MLPKDNVIIRRGQARDAEAIAEILNFYIEHTTCTFQVDRVTADDRLAWIRDRKGQHGLWVAERQGRAIGWAALSDHRPRPGFEGTAENSVYVHPNYRRQGVGLQLLNRMIEDAYVHDLHTIVAGVCTEQEPSIRLHEKAGYVQVGRYREIARKYNRWLDIVFLQRLLTPETRPGRGPLGRRPPQAPA